MRLLAPKLRVALHRRSTIHERVDHLDAFEDAMVILAMSFKRLDHGPLIGGLDEAWQNDGKTPFAVETKS